MYLDPCAHIDERIEDACTGLRAALGNPARGTALLPAVAINAMPEQPPPLSAIQKRAAADQSALRMQDLERDLGATINQSSADIARGAPISRGGPSGDAFSGGGGSSDELVVGFMASLEARKLNGKYVKK